jgi:hypothetical protein
MNFDPTIDYGLSDLAIEENLVYYKFGELIKALVTLSSSAERQIEITGAGIVTIEMAEDFNTYFTLSYKPFVQYELIDEKTFIKLFYLENFLDHRSGERDSEFWNDKTLATNTDWENVRKQSKNVLALLGFENLDIDFIRTEKYEKSNEGQKLLLQTTRTRLIKKT